MGRPLIVKAHLVKQDGTLSVIIPKEIREKMGVTKGTELVVYEESGQIVYEPLTSVRRR